MRIVGNNKSVYVLLIVLFRVSSTLIAQNRLPDGSQAIIVEMTSRIADIDSSLFIDHYSPTQRKALLKHLYQTDQQYRDSAVNGSQSTAKQQLFSHKIVANDQANQVLLRKLVGKFGWPTQREYGDQGAFTAWLIVWHAAPNYQKQYYPLIKKAYKQGLVKQDPTQLDERLRRFSN
ncbi:hypothetical protein [uncultured Spirosoma sp.]|uniref:hypothetical protein n=1 Tax=uncultured Spirosoma sp. TaxID=278208 RepID=UPI002588FC69|nr:hypothetical protein [uncultured Spirosoma sp.]